MHKCRICKMEKDFSEFRIRSDTKKLRNECKKCIHEYEEVKRREYGIPPASPLKSKEEKDKTKKAWRNNNKEHNKKLMKIWREENKEHIDNYSFSYKETNKKEINLSKKKYNKNRMNNDPVYRLRTNASKAIYSFLKESDGSKEGKSIKNYFDFSFEDLKSHLEKQFEEWMTWENQGKYIKSKWDDNDKTTWKWQLDHIIPQSDLPCSSMEHENFKKCWSLDNLRPLSAKQNQKDGATRARHLNERKSNK